jgi:HEAT repeat protein
VIGAFIDDEGYAELFQQLLKAESIPHEVLKIVKEKKLIQFRSLLNKIFSDTTKGLWTRYYALMALGAFEDPSLFRLFVEGLQDQNSLIKIGSLKALNDLKDKKAIVHVKPLINNKDEDVRSTAEFVMNSLGDPR